MGGKGDGPKKKDKKGIGMSVIKGIGMSVTKGIGMSVTQQRQEGYWYERSPTKRSSGIANERSHHTHL